MLNKLDYSYNDEISLIHRIDPLLKFIGLFIYILVCLFKYDNILFIINLSLVFIIILFSNVSIFIYLYQLDIMDINIVVFKIVFLVLYMAVIVYTTTKEDIGKGLAKVINVFNLIGINIKKISSCQNMHSNMI